jgi:methoxymalonate biosynthesis acyl carrier protein
MEVQEIMLELRNYIKEQFEVPENDPDFNDDVHLFDYGYIDSFGAVELITFVETTFSINISESDLVVYPLNTIREIASFALNRKEGGV